MINNNYQNILIKFGLWLGTGILIAIVGISNVFADTTYDMKDFVKLTGRRWSVTGNETSSNITYDNDWVKNNYNFTGGIYTPPNTYDRINYSFFEKNNGVFNPCTNDDFTATFKIKFSNLNLMAYISSISWSGVACSQVQNLTTGTIDVVCTRSPLTGNYNDIFVNYRDYTGTDTSDIYISRYMTISCGLNTGAIINNNNQNTQNIINNNNNNTQEIINNQNENTDKEIESQKVCSDTLIDKNFIVTNNKYIYNTNGAERDSSTDGITDYIKISSEDVLTGLVNYQYSYSCFYDELKTVISCFSNNFQTNSNITIPENAFYVRFSIYKNNNIPRFNLHQCKNGNQALNDNISNLDNTLKDDTVDDNGIASAFEDFNDFLDDNSTITQLITLPITLYTAILNNVNGSCTPFNLGALYGENLILPCINISQYLGNSLWNMIDIIISGFAVYAISKKMIKVFNNFSSLREGDVIDD